MLQDRPLPSLSVLRCFEAAAKYESFSAAAEQLNLSQGAVSRHVKDLEAYVGAALFQREGRGVRLTPAGSALAFDLSQDLDRMRTTFTQAIAAGEHDQIIRISAPPTFSSRWLLPRLNDFRKDHPNTEFIFTSLMEPLDLRTARLDLAIHFGGYDWPNAKMTPLCPENLVVAVSPALVSAPIHDPIDFLQNINRLHLISRPQMWETAFMAVGSSPTTVRSGSYFDQFSMMIAAAKAGLGAAILPTYLIEEELENGSLVRVVGLPADTAHQYYIVTALTSQRPLLQKFASWLRAQVT